MLYTAALRTQVYLTREQRARLDALSEARGESLAELIRDAVDEFLTSERLDPEAALASSFGAAPMAEVPGRRQWRERAAQ